MSFVPAAVRRNPLLPSYIIVAALLVVLIITGGIVSDRFLSWRNASNLFQQMAVLGLASLGQTFVILLGGIDLAVGSLVSATTVFLGSFLEWRPDLVWVAVPAALIGAASIGALNGYLSTRLGVHPLIVTLGTSSIIFGPLSAIARNLAVRFRLVSTCSPLVIFSACLCRRSHWSERLLSLEFGCNVRAAAVASTLLAGVMKPPA